MKKNLFIMLVEVILIFSSPLAHSSTKKNIGTKRIAPEMDSIFENLPSEEEMNAGRKIIKLFSENRKNIVKKSFLTEWGTLDLKNTAFAPYAFWHESLKKIVSLTNPDEFYSLCSSTEGFYPQEHFAKTLHHQVIRQCLAWFLTRLTEHIKRGKTPGAPSLNLLEQNAYELVSGFNFPYFREFLDALQAYPALHQQISQLLANKFLEEYRPFRKEPHGDILRRLAKSERVLEFFKTTELQKNFSSKYILEELVLLSKSIKKSLSQAKDYKLEIIGKTLELITNFRVNRDRLPAPETAKELFSLGKQLVNNHFYNLGRQVLSMALTKSTTEEEHYETVFHIFWSFIKTKEYGKAMNIVSEFKLQESFSELPSQLKFWMAYLMEQMNRPQEALKYYEQIIYQHPISYYSIMASKKMIQLEEKEKTGIVINPWRERLLGPPPKLMTSKKLFTDDFLLAVKRIHVWSHLGAQYFLNMEGQHLAGRKRHQVFADLESVKSMEDKEVTTQMVLILAKILFSTSNYLKSFHIIQKALEENQITFNKELMLTLFPNLYQKQIESLEKEVDPYIILSLVRQESAFNPKAKSTAGATGLMQLMLPTARSIHKKVNHRQLETPMTNLKIGITYLKRLLKKYDGNLVYALAAYNAGERNLERWIKNIFTTDSLLHTIESIPYQETRLYVKLIFRNIFFYKALHEGLDDSHHVEKIFNISLVP